LERKVGKTITVLVDEVDEEGAIARSSADAPEIDGLVYVEDGQQLKVGDLVDVKVTDSDEHDLWAEIA
jgi:ribosomal protein S12 methylthiotransferase